MPRYLSTCIIAAVLLAAPLRATSVLPPSFEELVAESEMILRGTVLDVRSETFESPQGTAVQTLVTLRVERSLKGAAPDTVTLNLLGGTAGKRTLRITGVPQFRAGERHIVFIAGNGRVFCPLIALGHGRYSLRHDAATGEEVVLRDNGLPLRSIQDVALPLHVAVPTVMRNTGTALTRSAFETQVTAMVTQQALKRAQP